MYRAYPQWDGFTVLCKPQWLCRIPFVGDATAQAIYPFIVLPPTQYSELVSGRFSSILKGTLVHEATHLKRQSSTGIVYWAFAYLCIPSFRYVEELAAIEAQMHLYREEGITFDTARYARLFNSVVYLWMRDEKSAYADLTKLWLHVSK